MPLSVVLAPFVCDVDGVLDDGLIRIFNEDAGLLIVQNRWEENR